ncbi:MAG: VOC family protein [Chloroflexota bacterium]
MTKQVFINLPVKDLKKTVDFFDSLGFSFDKRFTNDDAACLIINENTYAMLLTEPFFLSFSKKELTDTSKSCEVMTALALESRGEIDKMYKKALSLGATSLREPKEQDMMYGASFADPDGHIWEILWMSPESMVNN